MDIRLGNINIPTPKVLRKSSDTERNPIGRRTESDRAADGI